MSERRRHGTSGDHPRSVNDHNSLSLRHIIQARGADRRTVTGPRSHTSTYPGVSVVFASVNVMFGHGKRGVEAAQAIMSPIYLGLIISALGESYNATQSV
ncbi:hypothetical protein Trydic_g6679 [Trypoxylus dichotomus]